jgi:hypothetical protein
MKAYTAISGVALCAGMTILVNQQGFLACVPPAHAWDSSFSTGVEIDTMTYSSSLTYGQALANYNTASNPTRDMITSTLPEGWLLASPALWLVPIGKALTALFPDGAAGRFAAALGGPPVMKGMTLAFQAVPPWEKMAPSLAVSWGDGLGASPRTIATALQVAAAGLSGGEVPTAKDGRRIDSYPGVAGVLAAWGYVPPSRFSGAKVNGRFVATLTATLSAYEEVAAGGGARLPFDTRATPDSGAITVGGRPAVDKAAVAAERHAAALAAFGLPPAPVTAPAPAAAAPAAVTAAAAPPAPAPTPTWEVAIRRPGGVEVIVGDAATVVAAVDTAVEAGLRWALADTSPAEAATALAAIRATLPAPAAPATPKFDFGDFEEAFEEAPAAEAAPAAPAAPTKAKAKAKPKAKAKAKAAEAAPAAEAPEAV